MGCDILRWPSQQKISNKNFGQTFSTSIKRPKRDGGFDDKKMLWWKGENSGMEVVDCVKKDSGSKDFKVNDGIIHRGSGASDV